MNKKDLLKMSLQNLIRRKGRTILTVIGVVIGTCSIVVMLSLGLALDRNFQDSLKQMGNLNTIEVYQGGYYGFDEGNSNSEAKLDDKAVASFEQIPGVEAVMPIKRSYFKIGIGKMVADVDVVGIKPENMEAFDFKVEEGRLLIEGDKDSIIFGKYIANFFYNPRLRNRDYNPWNREGPPPVNLINNKIIMTTDFQYGERVKNRDPNYKPGKLYEVKGVGILQESFDEKDYSAYMNIATLDKIMKEEAKNNRGDSNRGFRGDNNNEQYNNIKVKCENIEVVAKVHDTIKSLGFQAHSLIDMLESMKKQSRVIQGILGGIGAVSLLVAAIGITNTMVMSIYERTREIGVIKVLGADLADIRRLFLIEAGLIGFFGGLIGLILSYLISFILNKIGAGYMGGPDAYLSVIPITLALGAVFFATLVGLISGYSPARRAMNLSALEAIRNE